METVDNESVTNAETVNSSEPLNTLKTGTDTDTSEASNTTKTGADTYSENAECEKTAESNSWTSENSEEADDDDDVQLLEDDHGDDRREMENNDGDDVGAIEHNDGDDVRKMENDDGDDIKEIEDDDIKILDQGDPGKSGPVFTFESDKSIKVYIAVQLLKTKASRILLQIGGLNARTGETVHIPFAPSGSILERSKSFKQKLHFRDPTTKTGLESIFVKENGQEIEAYSQRRGLHKFLNFLDSAAAMDENASLMLVFYSVIEHQTLLMLCKAQHLHSDPQEPTFALEMEGFTDGVFIYEKHLEKIGGKIEPLDQLLNMKEPVYSADRQATLLRRFLREKRISQDVETFSLCSKFKKSVKVLEGSFMLFSNCEIRTDALAAFTDDVETDDQPEEEAEEKEDLPPQEEVKDTAFQLKYMDGVDLEGEDLAVLVDPVVLLPCNQQVLVRLRQVDSTTTCIKYSLILKTEDYRAEGESEVLRHHGEAYAFVLLQPREQMSTDTPLVKVDPSTARTMVENSPLVRYTLLSDPAQSNSDSEDGDDVILNVVVRGEGARQVEGPTLVLAELVPYEEKYKNGFPANKGFLFSPKGDWSVLVANQIISVLHDGSKLCWILLTNEPQPSVKYHSKLFKVNNHQYQYQYINFVNYGLSLGEAVLIVRSSIESQNRESKAAADVKSIRGANDPATTSSQLEKSVMNTDDISSDEVVFKPHIKEPVKLDYPPTLASSMAAASLSASKKRGSEVSKHFFVQRPALDSTSPGHDSSLSKKAAPIAVGGEGDAFVVFDTPLFSFKQPVLVKLMNIKSSSGTIQYDFEFMDKYYAKGTSQVFVVHERGPACAFIPLRPKENSFKEEPSYNSYSAGISKFDVDNEYLDGNKGKIRNVENINIATNQKEENSKDTEAPKNGESNNEEDSSKETKDEEDSSKEIKHEEESKYEEKSNNEDKQEEEEADKGNCDLDSDVSKSNCLQSPLLGTLSRKDAIVIPRETLLCRFSQRSGFRTMRPDQNILFVLVITDLKPPHTLTRMKPVIVTVKLVPLEKSIAIKETGIFFFLPAKEEKTNFEVVNTVFYLDRVIGEIMTAKLVLQTSKIVPTVLRNGTVVGHCYYYHKLYFESFKMLRPQHFLLTPQNLQALEDLQILEIMKFSRGRENSSLKALEDLQKLEVSEAREKKTLRVYIVASFEELGTYNSVIMTQIGCFCPDLKMSLLIPLNHHEKRPESLPDIDGSIVDSVSISKGVGMLMDYLYPLFRMYSLTLVFHSYQQFLNMATRMLCKLRMTVNVEWHCSSETICQLYASKCCNTKREGLATLNTRTCDKQAAFLAELSQKKELGETYNCRGVNLSRDNLTKNEVGKAGVSKYCKYHTLFGKDAKNCSSLCSFGKLTKTKKQSQEDASLKQLLVKKFPKRKVSQSQKLSPNRQPPPIHRPFPKRRQPSPDTEPLPSKTRRLSPNPNAVDSMTRRAQPAALPPALSGDNVLHACCSVGLLDCNQPVRVKFPSLGLATTHIFYKAVLPGFIGRGHAAVLRLPDNEACAFIVLSPWPELRHCVEVNTYKKEAMSMVRKGAPLAVFKEIVSPQPEPKPRGASFNVVFKGVEGANCSLCLFNPSSVVVELQTPPGLILLPTEVFLLYPREEYEGEILNMVFSVLPGSTNLARIAFWQPRSLRLEDNQIIGRAVRVECALMNLRGVEDQQQDVLSNLDIDRVIEGSFPEDSRNESIGESIETQQELFGRRPADENLDRSVDNFLRAGRNAAISSVNVSNRVYESGVHMSGKFAGRLGDTSARFDRDRTALDRDNAPGAKRAYSRREDDVPEFNPVKTVRWDTNPGLSAMDQTSYTGLPAMNQTSYTCRPAMDQTSYTGLPAMDRTSYTGLPAIDRSSYTGRPEMNQTSYTGLPAMDRTSYTGRPEMNRTSYTGLPAMDRTPYTRMNVNSDLLSRSANYFTMSDFPGSSLSQDILYRGGRESQGEYPPNWAPQSYQLDQSSLPPTLPPRSTAIGYQQDRSVRFDALIGPEEDRERERMERIRNQLKSVMHNQF